MKPDFKKIFLFILLLVCSAPFVEAGILKGIIIDKTNKEPLSGTTVQIVGTTQGAVADLKAAYIQNLDLLAERYYFKQFEEVVMDGQARTIEEVTRSYKPGRSYNLTVGCSF